MRRTSQQSLEARTDEFARGAKALAHPARVTIVIRLAGGKELMAGDIVAESGLAQSTVSEHLRVLRDARIVAAREDGPRVWYRLDTAVLRDMQAALGDLVD